MPDIVTCQWPADGHAPPTDEPNPGDAAPWHTCQATSAGWFASPRPMTDPVYTLCIEHCRTADAAGWHVHDGTGLQWADVADDARLAEPRPETVQELEGDEPEHDHATGQPVCMWPQDGHAPNFYLPETYTGCGLTPCTHVAVTPDRAHIARRLPVCAHCGDLAEAAGWVFEALPSVTEPTRAEADRWVEATADLGDGRGERRVRIRRATPAEAAAFEAEAARTFEQAYDGVKGHMEELKARAAGRALGSQLAADLVRRAERVRDDARQQMPARTGPTARSIPPELADLLATTPRPLPRPGWRGLFPEGDEPRGCVAPLVAGLVLGTAVGLAAAGELAEQLRRWAERRG